MSRMTAKVVRALRSRPVREALAKVAQEWAVRHIDEGAGRDGQFKPLKRLYGIWFTKKGKAVLQPGRRNNGQPLRDTGRGMNSLRGECAQQPGGMVLRIRGEPYMKHHERGFKTRGPNFIPLTNKGKRIGGKAAAIKKAQQALAGSELGLSELLELGASPGDEARAQLYDQLKQGKDYIMAWNGVTVPARPFMLPTKDDMRKFGRSIAAGLAVVLNARTRRP